MPSIGKHRRIKNSALKRRIAAAGTGIALPVIAVGAANAATPTKAHAAGSAAASAHREAPAKEAKAAPHTAAKAEAKAKPKPKSGHRTHVVKSGETLGGIAQAEGVSLQRLYAANKQVIGSNPNVILPHEVLTVPQGHADPKHEGKRHEGKKHETTKHQSERHETKRPATEYTKPHTTPPQRADRPAPARSYSNNLHGWITQSLDIMRQHGIPGTYDGILRNVMRESGGNPNAINNWDSNAKKGTPSKGVLQMIEPTFRAYHVPGTANDPYDPVANIVAASNYAAHRYGSSIDSIHGAY